MATGHLCKYGVESFYPNILSMCQIIGDLGDSEHVSVILKMRQSKGSRVKKKPTEDRWGGVEECVKQSHRIDCSRCFSFSLWIVWDLKNKSMYYSVYLMCLHWYNPETVQNSFTSPAPRHLNTNQPCHLSQANEIRKCSHRTQEAIFLKAP